MFFEKEGKISRDVFESVLGKRGGSNGSLGAVVFKQKTMGSRKDRI